MDPFFFGAAFFFAGFAADFLAVVFFVAFAFTGLVLAVALALGGFLEAVFATVLPVLPALQVFAVRSAFSASVSSASGSGITPVSAPSSTTTTSDQRMS